MAKPSLNETLHTNIETLKSNIQDLFRVEKYVRFANTSSGQCSECMIVWCSYWTSKFYISGTGLNFV